MKMVDVFYHQIYGIKILEVGKSARSHKIKRKINPDSWEINYEKLPNIIKVLCVLKHIRNALAHGSIFTLPNENDKIKEIIFLSEIRIGNEFRGNYNVLKVCPEDFKEFLQNWMKFLIEDLKIPAEVGQT